MKKNKNLIVVLGAHRSGTSAIAGLLEHLGASFGDNLIPAGPDNTKGFWEDAELVALNDELLSSIGMKWSDCRQIDWTPKIIDALIAQWGVRAEALLLGITSEGSEQYVIKDPRLSRLLPFWLLIFKKMELKINYIWVTRTPNAVCKSLMSRNKFSLDKSAALWLAYNQSIARNLGRNKAYLVDYDIAMSDEIKAVKKISEAFKIVKEKGRYVKFFDVSMRHSQGGFSSEIINANILAKLAQDMYQALNFSFTSVAGNIFNQNLRSRSELALGENAKYLDLMSDLADAAAFSEGAWLREQQEKLAGDLRIVSERYNERGEYIEHLEKEKAELLIEQEKLVADNKALQSEKEKLFKNIGALNENATGLSEELNKVTRNLFESNHDVKVKRDEIHNLWVRINELSQENESLYKSSSWRLMVWYRVLGRLIKYLLSLPVYLVYFFYHLIKKRFINFSNFANSSNNIKVINQLGAWRSDEMDRLLQQSRVKKEKYPELDVSVVTYNSEKWLDGFFDSLLEQNYPLKKMNLLFTDNSSSDATFERLEGLVDKFGDKFCQVNVELRPNTGFGSGHNHAIVRSKADYILVTNVDLEFSSNAITEVIKQAQSDDEAVVSWELRQQPFEHPKYYDPITLDVTWSSHACVLMRREAYFTVGGYEKKIFMYGEDVELSYRFRRAGYRLKYVPSAVVFHYTYEYENEVKPLQFFGSTLANAYIRLRYGKLLDIFGIFGLYGGVLIQGRQFKGARRGLLKNLVKIFVNMPYFLASRKKSIAGNSFPFRFWDYEMIREGAFYKQASHEKTKLPLVSVVMRTYAGREAYLREAMASVLQQVYPNVELLVVEDGGNSHQKMIKRYQRLFSHGKKLRYSPQPKKGRSHTGNVGLAMAKGAFMVFLDDDDLLLPDHIEVLVSELLANENLGASYSLAWEVLTRRLEGKSRLYYEEMFNTPDVFRQEFDREALQHHNYLPVQAVIFKRELFEKYGGFEEDMDQLEDWNLWVRYSFASEFKYVPKTTSMFRTPYSTGERARRQQLLHESYEMAMSKQIEFIENN